MGLVFAGDLVPTAAHLQLACVMAYDLSPTTTIDEKQRLFHLALTERLCLALPHEPTAGALRLSGTAVRTSAGPVALP